MRRAKPWYWTERGGWYAVVRGKRELLAKGGPEAKPEAERELHRILAREPGVGRAPASHSPDVREIVDRFHDHAMRTLKPSTMDVYSRRLDHFKRTWGDLAAADLRPRHVAEWLDGRKWGAGTRRTATVIVRRAFSWATRQGYLERDPTIGVEKPRETRREAVPSPEAVAAIRGARMKPAMRDFLEIVALTGCRPGEACRVTARDFDPASGTWTIEGKTTRKTGRMRVVYLTDPAGAICARLAEARANGPLFLNTRGRPWTIQAYGKQIRRLRKRLGLGAEVVAVALRHVFCTDALERGIPIATVAELLGHTSTVMVSKVYSHLSGRTEHLRDAVRKIRPDPDNDDALRRGS